MPHMSEGESYPVLRTLYPQRTVDICCVSECNAKKLEGLVTSESFGGGSSDRILLSGVRPREALWKCDGPRQQDTAEEKNRDISGESGPLSHVPAQQLIVSALIARVKPHAPFA